VIASLTARMRRRAKPQDRRQPLGLTWSQFVGVAVLVAAGIALHAVWLPLPISATLFGLIAVRLWSRRRGNRRAPLVVRVLVVAGLMAMIVTNLGGLLGREAGSALLGAMLVMKLMETDTLRDARVVVTVACFLALAGFLFDQGPLQSLLTLGVVLLVFAVMHELAVPQAAERRGWLPFGTLGLRESLRFVALAIPFALVAFMLFPRLSQPMWGAPEDSFSARTGLSDRMDPGGISALFLDDTPVMRVSFESELPPSEQRYFRGLVFWRFDGEVWDGWNWTYGEQRHRQSRFAVEPLDPPIRYEVMLEPTDQRWLFTLDAPLAAPLDSTLTLDGQSVRSEPVTSLVRYSASSSPRYRLEPTLSMTTRGMGLMLPEGGNPQSRALAAEWAAQHPGDAREIARRALAIFNADFIYTAEPPLLARDRIDDFLFNTRAGYCEHFSSAFTFLMRAAGVPARVVVGFQGGVYNAAGDYLIVRRSDAHAWSEIWVDGEGWVRIDPTAAVAPERVFSTSADSAAAAAAWNAPSWFSAIRDRIDVVRYWWNEAVVQFNALRQRDLLRRAGFDDPDAGTAGIAMIVAGIAVLALAGLIAQWRRRRAVDPLLTQWRRWCAHLARAGVQRRDHEGPLDYAARAAAQLPTRAAAIAEVSRRYVALRYARAAASNDDIRAFRALVDASLRI
jgi:transglutaminase-like putative cysteine protease